MVVTREEKQRFELQHSVSSKSTENQQKENEFEYNADFTHISCNGYIYTLGMLQANVVKILCEASQTDNPWVYGKVALYDAGSTMSKISALFRNVPDWRELILSDGRGQYRLNLPSK